MGYKTVVGVIAFIAGCFRADYYAPELSGEQWLTGVLVIGAIHAIIAVSIAAILSRLFGFGK